MKIGSVICFILSVLFVGYALFMDVSVSTAYGRVNNIGLIAGRQAILIIGGFLFLATILLYVFSRDSVKTKTCPVCAEKIKVDAIKCRFCGAEQDQSVVVSDDINKSASSGAFYMISVVIVIIFVVLCVIDSLCF